jgi:hypothetical protein
MGSVVPQTDLNYPSTLVKDPRLKQGFYGLAYTPSGAIHLTALAAHSVRRLLSSSSFIFEPDGALRPKTCSPGSRIWF